MIRVLIAEDSDFIAGILREILSRDPEIIVVGRAVNGEEAISKTKLLRPDCVTMDIVMPLMDGLKATEIIMQETPTPILVISSADRSGETDIAFSAIRAGAVDVVRKPLIDDREHLLELQEEIVKKVKLVSKIIPIRRPALSRFAESPAKSSVPEPTGDALVAIGASTGGPPALASILKGLDGSFPWPILIVQHMAQGFIEGFAEWLDSETGLKVVVARHGMKLEKGKVFICPDNVHMGVRTGGRIFLSDSSPIGGHRPSVTFLMRTVAEDFGRNSIGVLLTGMGRDGADGLKEIRESGGITMAQDEESCVVFGMPGAAVEIGAAEKVVPLADIPKELTRVPPGWPNKRKN